MTVEQSDIWLPLASEATCEAEELGGGVPVPARPAA